MFRDDPQRCRWCGRFLLEDRDDFESRMCEDCLVNMEAQIIDNGIDDLREEKINEL